MHKGKTAPFWSSPLTYQFFFRASYTNSHPKQNALRHCSRSSFLKWCIHPRMLKWKIVYAIILGIWIYLLVKQETLLLQRDHATRYVSKFVLLYKVWDLVRIQTGKMTFKVIERHWQWCHLIGHIRFPISVPLQLRLYLAPLTRYDHLFPKTWRGHVTYHTSFRG